MTNNNTAAAAATDMPQTMDQLAQFINDYKSSHEKTVDLIKMSILSKKLGLQSVVFPKAPYIRYISIYADGGVKYYDSDFGCKPGGFDAAAYDRQCRAWGNLCLDTWAEGKDNDVTWYSLRSNGDVIPNFHYHK